MKVLLIEPPVKHMLYPANPKFSIDKTAGVSLGLLYLDAYLRHNSPYQVKILDCSEADSSSISKIRDFLLFYQPNLVGITGYTVNWIDIVWLTRLIKNILPDVHLSLGGAHATMFPRESLSFSCIDSVVLGEGEKALLELCNAVESKGCWSNIKGVITKERKDYDFSDELVYSQDLDLLSFPDRENVINLDRKIRIDRSGMDKRAIMVGSRGCPYSCAFCSKVQEGYRIRSIENIVDEIEFCIKQGFRFFSFHDEIFNTTPSRIIKLSEEILRRNLKIRWNFRTRVDSIDERMLLMAKKAGCKIIGYGVETHSDRGLQILNKGITVEQIERAFYLTRKAKILSLAYFMLGCPYEKTEADVRKTINFAYRLNPDFIVFSILTLYPGASLYALALAKGIISEDIWRGFVLNPSRDFVPPYWSEYFTHQELQTLVRKAYKTFYLHPGRILGKIKKINFKEDNLYKKSKFFLKVAIGKN